MISSIVRPTRGVRGWRAPAQLRLPGCPPAALLVLFFSCSTLAAQDTYRPVLVFNPIAIQLDSAAAHTLSSAEIDRIANGSTIIPGVTQLSVTPSIFGFCDLGQRTVTLSLRDSYGNSTNREGTIEVLAPPAPSRVYVDPSYTGACDRVAFPRENPVAHHVTGFDAFSTIQAAVDHVADEGVVQVAAGDYYENVVISKPLFLLGPNVGLPGYARNRGPEARIIPARSDPENTPIISVESDDVVIDGFCLDGHNPLLPDGYDAGGVRVHAAAGIQNGVYPDLADVAAITLRNNIITNISYDGICLDRYQYFGTSSAWNYIRNNLLVNMWEGILTYSLDSVIANNVISNVTHGLGVHCVATAAPKGFQPLVASNVLSIAHWWPAEISVARAPGIWVNFRQENASPIEVRGNQIITPVEAPPLKTIVGLFALTVDSSREVRFTDNTVDGQGNCSVGFLAAACRSNSLVLLSGGVLRHMSRVGVLADTLDAKWGADDTYLTISNVAVAVMSNAVGVMALQQSATPENTAGVQLVGGTAISGGACGVQVRGTNAWASIVGPLQFICENEVGVDADVGRVLIENNILTSNRVAAITVENGGIVDAGDCQGGNITGLGTGTGANGSSAGFNDLSGYGCDRAAPWAIRNNSTVPVLADRNHFDIRPGEKIDDVLSGAVLFSDSVSLSVIPPPTSQVLCISDMPPGATTVEDFRSQGGLITAGTATAVAFVDTVITNWPGYYTLFRRYSISGGCSQTAICQQIMTALDTQPPVLHCSDTIIKGVDPGCDYATVTFTNVAADACGELLGPWEPVSTGRFPVGTNTVIEIATDLANNTSICSFDVAVIGLPVITRQPTSRTNLTGTTASFSVTALSAAPISYHWNHNRSSLADGGQVSGASSSEVIVSGVVRQDAGDYQVDVSNLAGTISSKPAQLTVLDPVATLRVVEWRAGEVTLQLTAGTGAQFALLTSTDFINWVGLHTNAAPFTYVHTGIPWSRYRFYRALPVPKL
jgi:hypothetical protein